MAEKLGVFIEGKCAESGRTQAPKIYTSTLPRAIETAQICANKWSTARVESVSALNPADVGACHGMTLGDIRAMLGKEELDKMRKHPGSARLPGGESQFDVTKRLEPFIVDYLERQTSRLYGLDHVEDVGSGKLSRGGPRSRRSITISLLSMSPDLSSSYFWKDEMYVATCSSSRK